jgi:hypothetical protein
MPPPWYLISYYLQERCIYKIDDQHNLEALAAMFLYTKGIVQRDGSGQK